MVFNECHYFLTSQGFCHKFQDCRKFIQFKFQKIYLTATLLSKLKDHLLTACRLSRTLIRIIRVRTYNPLISYYILQVKTDIIINSSVQLAQQLQILWTLRSCNIIFGSSKEDVALVAKKIKSTTTHEASLSSIEKQKNYQL